MATVRLFADGVVDEPYFRVMNRGRLSLFNLYVIMAPLCRHPIRFTDKCGIYLGYDYPTGWFYGTLAGTRFDQVTFTEGDFTEVAVVFTTGDTPPGLGEELWISLYALGSTGSYAAFDNVRLSKKFSHPYVVAPSS